MRSDFKQRFLDRSIAVDRIMPSSSSSSLPLPRSPIFTPIPEHDKEEEEEEDDDDDEEGKEKEAKEEIDVSSGAFYVHNPAPVHRSATDPKADHQRPSRSGRPQESEVASVSCNNCRPTSRDKLISVVPLDSGGRHGHHPTSIPPSPGPGGLLRSLFFSLTRRSPAAVPGSSSSTTAASAAVREDQWRLVAAELSRKLLHTTRKRDEALLKVSRLKFSVAELERKLEHLESHCRGLRSAALQTGQRAPGPAPATFPARDFHLAVADARTAVRRLARALISQFQHAPRSSDRVAALIQPYDHRAAAQWRRNPAGLLFYMEALLNRVFYARLAEDAGEEEGSMVDPAARCAASRAAYESVRGLSWDEVLSKGTKHYSEGLSQFCDRKMSEVVAMVGWTTRAWPEGLLQAFFGAAKGAWVVAHMARSVHPAVPAMRAGQGARFDGRFMEDVAADRVRRLTPASVRMMVAPGFHVYTDGSGVGVVKCTVLCVYAESRSCDRSEKVL